jgi:hypothetical protein
MLLDHDVAAGGFSNYPAFLDAPFLHLGCAKDPWERIGGSYLERRLLEAPVDKLCTPRLPELSTNHLVFVDAWTSVVVVGLENALSRLSESYFDRSLRDVRVKFRAVVLRLLTSHGTALPFSSVRAVESLA